jgi:hypothetical protein
MSMPADLILLLAMAISPVASPGPRAIAVQTATLAQAGPPADWRGAPPPPPPAMERVRPRRGYVWVEGGAEWRRGKYVRQRGHWERERPGRQWHGGHWEWQGDHYGWVQGSWIEGPAYVPPPALVVETPAPPPPPPQVETVPPPRPGFVWIAGAHEWREGRYVWVAGHWEPARPGDTWQTGHWDTDGDRHGWHPGSWEHGMGRGGISIEGRIVDQAGRPAAGITVVLAGRSEGRAVTDGNGRYAFTGLVPGSYAVRPNDPRCGFGPDVMNLNHLAANAVQDFRANCR